MNYYFFNVSICLAAIYLAVAIWLGYTLGYSRGRESYRAEYGKHWEGLCELLRKAVERVNNGDN